MFTLTAKIISALSAAFMIFNPFTSFLRSKPETIAPQKAHEVTYEMFDYDEPMDVHKPAQKKYLAAINETKKQRYNGKLELSRPEPAYLAWKTTVDETETELDGYTVYLGTDPGMKNAAKYTVTEGEVKIYNVFVGETYYWYVEGEYDGDIYKSEISSFKTAPEGPRNIFVDGVTNVRDLGGWECAGGRVKQGMVYRTAKLHDDESTNITESGIKTMRDELGVKTEVDLRFEVEPREYGVLGEDVKYVLIPLDFSDDMMLDSVQAGYIRDFFKVLADESNYPVFFHCMIGTDRTGLCAFLLNGLLGVSQDDIYRDYCFSNFGFIGGERDGHNITHDIELLDRYEGAELKDRIASYLISIGITEDEIDTIRKIMIEKK